MRLRSGLLLFLMSLLLAGSAAAAAGKLLGLKTSVDGEGTTILLRLPVPVEFTPSQVGPRLYLVDVAGVTSDQPTTSQPVQSPLVSSYRVFSYHGADDRPHLGLELTLKNEARIQPSKVADGLQLRIEPAGSRSAAASTAAPQQAASQSPVGTPGSGSKSATPVPSAAASKQVGASPAAASAAKQTAASGKATLREVSVVQPENASGLEVEIVAEGDLTYKTTRLRSPERLVLDLPNTLNRIKQTRLDVNTAPLKTVRIAQYKSDPPIARVVMDLDNQVSFNVRNQSSGLVIALNAAGGSDTLPKKSEVETPSVSPATTDFASAPKPAVSKPSASAAATPAAPKVQLAVHKEAAPISKPAEPILLASNEPASVIAPASLSVPAKNSQIAPPAQVMPAVKPESPAPPAPVAVVPAVKPEAAPATAPAPAKAAPQSMAEAMPSTPLMVAQARPAVSSVPAPQAGQQQFTGEPISLNLKDVDLKDFFRLMHEVSGLNVVLDPGVSGTVTIVLDDVPWDQAMDIVLKNNGLEARTVGNVVRIAKVSTLENEAKAQLAKAKAEADREEQATPRETVTRALGYAKAADLVTPLKRFLSARGDIVPDVRTNTLIITDIPDAITKIDALIQTLDQKTPQVEIEARIVSATRTFARDIGVQLAASGASGNVVLGGAGVVGDSPINRGRTPPLFSGSGTPPTDPTQFANLAQPLAVNFGAVAPTSGLSLVLTGGRNFALDEIITAAESRGLGKLLSRPKIITQNNVEGNVEQGVKIPLQTSVNNTVTVQYQKVTLRLTVTPQITSEGTIFLKTDIENTTIDPGIPRILGVPALDTQIATTQVLVTDGGTVFFGGVIQTDNNLTEQETPLLGSIPLVGHLFKRKATSTSTKELLFFITPKIIQS